MTLRLIQDLEVVRHDGGADPRDPALYRTGISSARAALRDGVARRHERELEALRSEPDPSTEDSAAAGRDPGSR